MKERPNLTQFMEQLIRALKEEERFSTAHIYQSTLNALRLFCKADVIRFNQMDRSRLKQFASHLQLVNQWLFSKLKPFLFCRAHYHGCMIRNLCPYVSNHDYKQAIKI